MDDMLGFRHAAGVIFGSFMLLPYMVLLYPAQLSSFFGDGTLGLFAGTSGIGGKDGLLILPLFLILTGVVLFSTGMPLLRGAYVSLKMRRPNTDLLVTITVVGAYVYSTVAFLLGRIDVYCDLTIVIAASVVAVIFYESLVKQRAMDLLTDLTVSQVDEARLYQADGTTNTIAVEDVEPDDRVLVRQGERIPVDGVLDEGECTVDEAVITGESLPVVKQAGDDVVGGSIVTDDAAVLRVGDRATSSIDQLTTAVWNIQSANHGVQRRADRLASLIIPGVVGVAVLAAMASFALGGGFPAALLTLLTVLLVLCPWALGLSTPLSVATSLKEATERGIVVFDETVFERLRDTDVVVFDKTGTLTTGEMEVIEADAPQDLLAAAADLERRASHPAADAIATTFASGPRTSTSTRSDGGIVDEFAEERPDRISDFQSHASGIQGTIDGTEFLVGHLDLFAEHGCSVSEAIETKATDARGFGRLPVVVGRDGHAEGIIVVGDEPRDGWDETVTRLGERGIDTIVLTGDDEEATDFFKRHQQVAHVFAGVPPEGKTATIRRLQSDNHVTMVGDGTNDAPALARADLGIALGSGTALASDAADITIVDDDLTAVETAFDLASAARRRVTQNTGLALLYNGITIPLAGIGLLNPLFAMVAVITSGSLIAVNSHRELLDE
jgi:heavy metal translocating P-type ATPase